MLVQGGARAMSFTDDDGFEPLQPATGGPHQAGDVIADRYRLERVLGEGGMGWLWAAHDEQLDVDVALKLLRTDVQLEAGAERLLNEAQAAARLEHPAIVTVFDVGKTPTGDPFIAMELLEGRDLGQLVADEGRLPVETAVALLLPVIEALAVAHEHGVIHRDLKPDNIFLVSSRGRTQPKIIDFGIARNERGVNGSITHAGVAMGSPDYMSPEQASGKRDIDGRADVWAVCTVLYETVCGRVPFADRPYNALLRSIIEDPVPSLSEHGVDDPGLQEILDTGFKKARDERWPGMRELGKALARLLLERGVLEDAAGSSIRSGWIEPRSSMVSLESISAQTFRSSPPAKPPELTVAAPAPARARYRTLLPIALVLAAIAALVVLLATRRRPAPDLPVPHSASVAHSIPAPTRVEAVASTLARRAPSPSQSAPAASAPSAPSAPPAPAAPAVPAAAARRRPAVPAKRARPAGSAPVQQPPPAAGDDLGF